MSKVIDEEKGDSWLRDELKLNQKSVLEAPLPSKPDEASRKRRECSNDQTGVDKKAKIEI